jgi:hypothetical protein
VLQWKAGGRTIMNLHRTILRWLPCLLAAPLLAQPQIGGGTCNSSNLNGTYSLTLSGRDLSSSVTFSDVLQGIGTATFDGLSKVTFNLTNNTTKLSGQGQTWSGTYSMQSNCIGLVNITSGDSSGPASFTLGIYDSGEGYFITGQDGVYSLLGSGNTEPPTTTTCTTSTLNGTYQFNANGFALSSGVIGGVNQLSGLMVFNGTGGVTATAVLSVSGSSVTITTPNPGTYSVAAGCTATASITDSLGNAYSLAFTITAVTAAGSGSNFIVSGASPTLLFSGNGRTL